MVDITVAVGVSRPRQEQASAIRLDASPFKIVGVEIAGSPLGTGP